MIGKIKFNNPVTFKKAYWEDDPTAKRLMQPDRRFEINGEYIPFPKDEFIKMAKEAGEFTDKYNMMYTLSLKK